MRPAVSRIVTQAMTSPARRKLVRAAAGVGRRLRAAGPVVDYFHQADDPYSHLAAQLAGPLAARYGVELRAWIAPPPDDAAAPERARLAAYALRDAARVAAEYGLEFPAPARPPSLAAVAFAQRILVAAARSRGFSEVAAEVGRALWRDDQRALATWEPVAAEPDEAAAAVAVGGAERARRGHYLGAMFHFEGEWFWGVDRLSHLEARLAAMGRDSRPDGPPLAPYRDLQLPPPPANAAPAVIEMWFSFRSPYSWLAMPRVRRLAEHYGARLELRYILPMVMRGLPVPPIKTRYIVLDAKREADRCGQPFGRIVDPVGAGAERALAVLHQAIPLGLGAEFAELALRAAWAEGIALAEVASLRDIARRAGLTDAQVAEALADDSWREAAEANRAALFDAGLWGAPTYRVNGGVAHWGQDRLWALEEDLVRAQAGAPATHARAACSVR
ncbi:MAG TPA: DsbA family protein [Caulobacteraceae bacterium]|nr:DsbA family protein [Caulobacteraceae bacterium]